MFCSVQNLFRVKFIYRYLTGGIKDAGKERMGEAGGVSNEHPHPKIRSLKQVLKESILKLSPTTYHVPTRSRTFLVDVRQIKKM